MKFKRIKSENKIVRIRPRLKDLMKIKGKEDFHDVIFHESLKTYVQLCKRKKKKLGSVLVMGSNQVEARNFPKYPFDKIVLSNVFKLDEATKKEINKDDSRIKEEVQELENIDAKSESYDYVFCKESLHHIPRPSAGLYEMLRVSKGAVTFIEPQETFIGRVLESLDIATKYDGFEDPRKEPKIRRKYGICYLYRWNQRELIKLLQSYYLESGYELYLNSFWLSNRTIKGFHPAASGIVKILGWLLSFFPFSRGNFIVATIVPGKSKPYEVK